jgi:hypothetical protein
MSLRITALTFASVALFGCTLSCAPEASVNLAEGPRDYDAGDYKRALKTWTREAELLSVDEMDNVLTVTSTYESWDFRWAYSERYARDYRLSHSKKEAHRKRSLDESKKFHQFYVALYAQRPKWGDLEVDDPAWIIRLVDSSGSEPDPAEMHKVRKPGAMELTYFPYTGSFRTVYRVSFPAQTKSGKPTIAPDSDWFALRFAGAQGIADVTWDVE